MLNMDTGMLIAIFVVMLVDRLFSVLKNRGIDLNLIAKQISELHEWHAISDAEGVKIWYVRRSLEEAILKLSDNLNKQTEVLAEIHREQLEVRSLLSRVGGRGQSEE